MIQLWVNLPKDKKMIEPKYQPLLKENMGTFELDNNAGEVSVEAMTEEALFIVLSGEPIDEPIVSYGPFVMNTMEEIREAYEDFSINKFGSQNF